jgi:hypothetical protein
MRGKVKKKSFNLRRDIKSVEIKIVPLKKKKIAYNAINNLD